MQLLLLFLYLLATGLCGRRLVNDGNQVLLGAPTDVQEPDTAKYRQWAWNAVVSRLRNSNSMFQSVPLKIVSAKTQSRRDYFFCHPVVAPKVVAGLLHKLHILIGASECRANHGGYDSAAQLTVEDCSKQLRPSGPYESCRLKVWERPWMHSTEITALKCRQVSKGALSKLASSGDLAALELPAGPTIGVIAVDGGDPIQIQLHSPAEKIAFKAFQDFIRTHNKIYDGGKVEYTRRFRVFQDNQRLIREMQRREKGSAVYGVTAFADLTPAEFKQQVLIPEWPLDSADLPEAATLPTDNLPPNYDWRQHNAVTPVKDQGQCGSCWAFSVTGNIEGQAAIKTGKLVSFSEQELLDCDKLDYGCMGGDMFNAYKELARLGGLETEKDYPYEGEKGNQTCVFKKSKSAVKIKGGVKISKDEDQMKAWLHENGPISIAIDAAAMQFYKHGVAHPWEIYCNPDILDHGVLIVGYGVTSDENKEPFWIVKNSWGLTFGEAGYWRVFRGGGVCGLNRMASSAVLQ